MRTMKKEFHIRRQLLVLSRFYGSERVLLPAESCVDAAVNDLEVIMYLLPGGAEGLGFMIHSR